jgi:hypothetical protein
MVDPVALVYLGQMNQDVEEKRGAIVRFVIAKDSLSAVDQQPTNGLLLLLVHSCVESGLLAMM